MKLADVSDVAIRELKIKESSQLLEIDFRMRQKLKNVDSATMQLLIAT